MVTVVVPRRQFYVAQPQWKPHLNLADTITQGIIAAVVPGFPEIVGGGLMTLDGAPTGKIAILQYGRAAISTLASPFGDQDIVWPVAGTPTLTDNTLMAYAANIAGTNSIPSHFLGTSGVKANRLQVGATSFTGYDAHSVTTTAITIPTTTVPALFTVRTVGTATQIFYNRNTVGSSATVNDSFTATDIRVGRGNIGGSNTVDSQTYLLVAWNRGLSDAEIGSLVDNPYRIFSA